MSLVDDPALFEEIEEEIVRPRMSLDEFERLVESTPDDKRDRYLLKGELWEFPMTVRNRWHGEMEAVLSSLLVMWSKSHAEFKVYSGEVGCRFPDHDTMVGIDVAVFPKSVIDQLDPEEKMITGTPILAVEIHSPSERLELIWKKVDFYREVEIPLVWLVDPHFQTITRFEPTGQPSLFGINDQYPRHAALPDLGFGVGELFQ